MGAWGIKSRESDRGLDLLNEIIDTLFVPNGFQTFDVQQVINLARKICKKALGTTFAPGNRMNHLPALRYNWAVIFDNALLLIAECAVEFYQTGKLYVDQYDGETQEFIAKAIPEMRITRRSLERLLRALQKVQDPRHPKFDSWLKDETRERWLLYIRSLYAELEKHYAEPSERRWTQ